MAPAEGVAVFHMPCCCCIDSQCMRIEGERGASRSMGDEDYSGVCMIYGV